jgi:hypothetical protein
MAQMMAPVLMRFVRAPATPEPARG